ncbi:NAD(P)-binding protein [Backusella circina FSU 941]|nr:NAD(P)-binding protein [Backusella circina FSU 941]
MSLPNEQTVYRITNFKSYKDIKGFQEPLHVELSPDEVLLKIKAVSLNYRDLIMTNDGYLVKPKKNVIPGSDASGEIVKVGSSVTNFEIGDRAITNFDPEHLYGNAQSDAIRIGCIQDGVLTQYKVISKYSINKIPKDSHLTHEEAASLVCTGVTAWNALFGSGDRFVAGQTILMLGTGGVSITTLVLAKAAGAVTIITSSSDDKLQYVKEKYGADYTINYRTNPDWEKEVLEITGGKGVDFVIENGGNGTIIKSIESLKFGGQVVLIGFVAEVKELPNMLFALLKKTATARGIRVGSKQLAEELIRFVHAKKLRMPVERVYGFTEENIHAAYASIESQTQVALIKLSGPNRFTLKRLFMT